MTTLIFISGIIATILSLVTLGILFYLFQYFYKNYIPHFSGKRIVEVEIQRFKMEILQINCMMVANYDMIMQQFAPNNSEPYMPKRIIIERNKEKLLKEASKYIEVEEIENHESLAKYFSLSLRLAIKQ